MKRSIVLAWLCILLLLPLKAFSEVTDNILSSVDLIPAGSGEEKLITWEEKYSDELFVYDLIEEVTKLNKNWTFDTQVHYITSIQKEGAKESGIGEVKIYYNRNYESVSDIKAFVVDKDGQKFKYKTIQDMTPYSGEPMYSSNRIKIITMPEIVPGNKIDYQAKISSTKLAPPRSFYKGISISTPMPAKMIRYQLKIPKGIEVVIQNQNTDLNPKIEEIGAYTVYTWEKENNDKFEFEEYMPAYGNVWAEIYISTLKDWKAIDSWYWGLVAKNIKNSPAIKAKVKELVAGLSTDKEKAQAIIKYMQDNIRYVSMSFDEYNYEPHPADEVYSNKYGDCKDQTVLAITMLNEAGINAYPCLFRDENRGDISGQVPMPLYFNHVILGVVLDGNIVYTDVLFKGYHLDETPIDIQGAYLVVINGQGGKFDHLPILGAEQNSMYAKADISINPDGSALIKQEKQYNNSISVGLIQRWKNFTEKEKNEYLQYIVGQEAPGGKILENHIENIDKEFSLIKHVIKCTVPQWAEVSGNYMSFSLGAIGRTEQFTKKDRVYPIWFQTNFIELNECVYHLPAGYHIATIPENKQLSSPFLDFTREYQNTGRDIIAREKAIYKRVMLPVTDYNMIQDVFEKLPQLTKEKIIIEKDKNIKEKRNKSKN